MKPRKNPPSPRLLFVLGSNLQAGHGEVRACARARRCLDAWVRYTVRHGGGDAHCARGCPAYEAAS